MLHDSPNGSGARLNGWFRKIHDGMYAGFLNHPFFGSFWRYGCSAAIEGPTIPDTAYVVPWDDLYQSSCLNMPDLNETAVEEKDIGCMHGHTFGCSFPVDDSRRTIRISLSVNEQAKF